MKNDEFLGIKIKPIVIKLIMELKDDTFYSAADVAKRAGLNRNDGQALAQRFRNYARYRYMHTRQSTDYVVKGSRKFPRWKGREWKDSLLENEKRYYQSKWAQNAPPAGIKQPVTDGTDAAAASTGAYKPDKHHPSTLGASSVKFGGWLTSKRNPFWLTAILCLVIMIGFAAMTRLPWSHSVLPEKMVIKIAFASLGDSSFDTTLPEMVYQLLPNETFQIVPAARYDGIPLPEDIGAVRKYLAEVAAHANADLVFGGWFSEGSPLHWQGMVFSERNSLSVEAYGQTLPELAHNLVEYVLSELDSKQPLQPVNVSFSDIFQVNFIYAEGMHHYRDGNLPAALGNFSRALQFDDAFQPARLMAARCYLETGEVDVAEQFLLQVIEEGSTAIAQQAREFFAGHFAFVNMDFQRGADIAREGAVIAGTNESLAYRFQLLEFRCLAANHCASVEEPREPPTQHPKLKFEYLATIGMNRYFTGEFEEAVWFLEDALDFGLERNFYDESFQLLQYLVYAHQKLGNYSQLATLLARFSLLESEAKRSGSGRILLSFDFWRLLTAVGVGDHERIPEKAEAVIRKSDQLRNLYSLVWSRIVLIDHYRKRDQVAYEYWFRELAGLRETLPPLLEIPVLDQAFFYSLNKKDNEGALIAAMRSVVLLEQYYADPIKLARQQNKVGWCHYLMQNHELAKQWYFDAYRNSRGNAGLQKLVIDNLKLIAGQLGEDIQEYPPLSATR